MDKLLGKLLLLAAVLGFGILYGVSMSSDGIERIRGPFGEPESEQVMEGWSIAEYAGKMDPLDGRKETVTPAQPIHSVSDSLTAKLFDKIGSLLHMLAEQLIRLLVSIGEAILS